MAPPVVARDSFIYNDVFLAQVDDTKRHARASVPELTSLLRPETSSAPPKDQVGHWYQAQLLHYGLPPSKDKNTAKVRLLQAINAGTLAVPGHVTQLEKEMKKELVAAARKAKLAEKTPTAPVKGKKRTHEEDIINTKVTLTVGGVTISVDQKTAASITSAAADAPPAAKKAKSTQSKSSTATDKPAKKAATAKPPQKAATTKPPQKAAPTRPDAPSKTKDPLVAAKAKAAPKSKDAPSTAKPKAAPKIKKSAETDTSKPTTSPKQTARKKEPHIKPELDGHVNGTYWLHLRSHSPDNVTEFNGPPRISIHHDVYTNRLWGHFTIGPKTGVLRVDNFVPENCSSVCDFDWRARDMGSEQLRFGRGCEGMMELGIHGLERGTFHRLFDGLDVEFGVSTITRDTQMDWPEWMDEWEDFAKEAYIR